VKRRGLLFILSAPSGAGKSTVGALVRRRLPDLAYSVSLTTRQPRPGEIDGKDYHFVSREDFARRVAEGEMAEYAEIFGNLYGTSALVLNQALDRSQDIFLDIDVEGAGQLTQKFPQAVTIFLLPPSAAELERRLRGRSTEKEDVLKCRLARAQEEMDQASVYCYRVINDDLNRAADEIVWIINNERSRKKATPGQAG